MTSNIFGVDLDPQAVEVTKLSLLLKCLEGESAQSITNLLLFHERALPDLGNNIKCGNSLVSTTFLLRKKLTHEQQAQLRPFSWKTEFPKVDGFDAVIGNPPYILMQSLALPSIFKYLAGKFEVAKYKKSIPTTFHRIGG